MSSSDDSDIPINRSVWFNNPHVANNDPRFISIFMAEILSSEDVINVLVGMGDFQHNKHNIHYGCLNNPDGECDDCYSGDTEHDMSHNDVLGDIWHVAYEKWKQTSNAEDDNT